MSQKVYEFAKELGIETITLMDKIREWKLPIKSHMATLDDGMMDQIREKLKGPAEPETKAKTKTKTRAKAKTPRKNATTKTVLVTRKKSGAETATTLIVKKDEDGEGKKKVVSRKSTVIRRKSKEDEAAEAALAEAAAAEENAAAGLQGDAGQAGGAEDGSVHELAAADKGTAGATEAAPARKRTNIIGRMDLSKARPPAGVGVDGRQARPGGPVRNIRTGFFAAPMAVVDEPSPLDEGFDRDRRRDKDKLRNKPAGQTREEEEQQFNASDFRKREVVFQPKKKKIAVNKDFKKTAITIPKKRVVKVFGTMKVADLAQAMGQKAPLLTKKLMGLGVMANMNTDLDFDTITLVANEFGYEVENVQLTPEALLDQAVVGDVSAEPVPRPPVVTVMGHVDHGKTSLLDAIRQENVAGKEAGGITQHIGAYKVKLESGKEITFIDTPGHEAFTAMRARGAQVTDVAIIVVAADDGVMPQTAEAINHAKAAEVPIIIAVNKIDKQGANIDRIKQQLTEYEIVPEEWGGSNIFCPVSALQKTGISELLDQILLVAELEDLKANPMRSGTGTVIEARVEKGRGPVATILVQDGVVRIGDQLVAGLITGRVRAMMNDKGQQVKQAIPGDPVEVLGFSDAPAAGDRFDVVKDETAAKAVVDIRQREIEATRAKESKGLSLEELFSKVKLGEVHELPIILKADVSGSVEAVKEMLAKASTDEVKVKIVHAAVGAISESDVLLASTAKGLIIGFNVRPDTVAAQRSKEKGVEVKCYNIVYNLVDDVKKAMAGLLQPDKKERTTGRAEVREVFSVPKVGNIAGSTVVDGKITRSDLARVVRDGVVVYEGKLGSLRRFKDDVREVASGYECGIGVENFNDIKAGDVIEAYVIEEVARSL